MRVAAVEAVCALTAILTHPGQIEAVTGWILSADGKWLVKLLGLALASQAWIASATPLSSQRRPAAETTFRDAQPSPLKHWREFAGDVEQVVGTSVDVTLRQRQSADGFATPVPIGCQFVVESP